MNECVICDNILDKDNRGIIMGDKCFVLNEEVKDVFHEKKLHFHNRKTVIEYLSCQYFWFNGI